jgi:flagellar motility protein MotE (MotC chaperone)
MKTGYDQFFKKAREAASNGAVKRPSSAPRFEINQRRERAPKTSDQVLSEQLRQRIQAKKKVKKAKVPWRLAGFSFLGLVIATAGYFEHERIEALLKRVEISMIGSASAQEKPAAPTAAPAEKAEAKQDEKKSVDEAKKKNFTEEELNHFAKLNERKRELDAREEELNRLESELQAQKVELEKRMQALEKTRREISSVLEEKVQTDDKKVETLVQMYSNMKPQQAAKVFEEMDEDLAVEIIGRMKKKNAAEIMNLIKAEKAKIFAEKFAGYKRN